MRVRVQSVRVQAREKESAMTEAYRNEDGWFAVSPDGEASEYYATRKELLAAVADGSAWCEPFALAAAPASTAKRFEFARTKTVQRVLLSGLNCLPGQQDLFDGMDGSR